MRTPLPLAALSSALLSLTACDPDPSPRCAEAYDHLIALSKRPPDGGERDRFVTACRDAFDEGRHACLLEATTADEALACRPRQVRPG